MKLLRLTFVLQIGFFAGWWGYLSFANQNAKELWLETQPVDPRDFLSGNYVALSYNLIPNTIPSCKDLLSKMIQIRDQNGDVRSFYVELKASGKKVRANGNLVETWITINCAINPPPPQSNGYWVQGFSDNKRWGVPVRFGIEKYFVGENSPLRNARSGSVVARVSLNSSHQLRLMELATIKP